MAYLTLYRKWRPQRFEDVIGQEPVVRTLTRALAEGRTAHAYLFAGPRGTGKTTLARLLAKGFNCEEGPTPRPCNRCESCRTIAEGTSLDVVEIDGASHRGIDEVRELRERVRYAPARARRKVYIIDEVHMLTHEAFNALLKVLEEPPSHVVFVFATTEPHKVPGTVMSRCQRFDFRRLSAPELAAHLARVAKAEGIEVEAQALELIARHADGGVRDALAMLEQCAAFEEGPLTARSVAQVLGLVPLEALARLAAAYAAGRVDEGLAVIRRLTEEEGVDSRVLWRDLVEYLGAAAVAAMVGPKAGRPDGPEEPGSLEAAAARLASGVPGRRLVAVLEALLLAEPQMRWAPDPRLVLELQLMKLAATRAEEAAQQPARQVSSPPAATPSPPPAASPPLPAALSPAPAAPSPPAAPPPPPARPPAPAARQTPAAAPSASKRTPQTLDLGEVTARWGEVLATLRSQQRRSAAKVEALLREGRPVRVEGLEVVVGFPADRDFHRTSIEDPSSRALVEKVLTRLFGRPVSIRTERLDDETATPLAPEAGSPPPPEQGSGVLPPSEREAGLPPPSESGAGPLTPCGPGAESLLPSRPGTGTPGPPEPDPPRSESAPSPPSPDGRMQDERPAPGGPQRRSVARASRPARGARVEASPAPAAGGSEADGADEDDFDRATLKAILEKLGGRLIKELDPDAPLPQGTPSHEGETENGGIARAL